MRVRRMDSEIVVGSVVVLKSGGPPMTVEDITEHKARCVFYNSLGAFITVDNIRPSMLKLAIQWKPSEKSCTEQP